MKKILIALLLFTNVCFAQLPCSVANGTVSTSSRFMMCDGSTGSKYARLFQIIDTTKEYYIAQGRGSTPFLLYFNGTAWVKNDTSYVPQSGTNKFSGDFLSNQSFFTFGLNSTNNNIIYSDQNYGRMISENSSSGIQSSVGAFSSSDGSIQLVVTNPTPAYSRQFVINGSSSATPNLAYMFDKGIAYYNGDYSAEMEASQNTIPSLKKVKQLISDSVGTVQSTTLADGKIWIGDGTDTAFPRTLSGDVTVSNLGVTTIDTLKVGRIEQGRGTAPIFMYFNGVAWVRNDTSYVSQTGTNKFSGNLLSNQSFLQVGLGSSNNTLTFTDEVFTGIKSASATSETKISAYSTSNGYADISVYNPLGGLYDRRMVITGTGNNTPDQSFRIQNGLLYYFGNYTSQMTDDRTVPDIGKVKQLISDSIGTVQSTTLPDGQIWIGDGTNTAFPRTLSGDVTVSNLGEATVDSINGITKSYYDPTSSIQTQLNSKQATIGLTTTGAIGAASYSNPTINIPKGYDELPNLGVIKSFTGSEFNITTDWNTASSGGSFAFGSNKLALSGTIGTTTYTNYVFISSYVSNLDIYSLDEDFKITTTPSATTYGFSTGALSVNPAYGLTIKVGMTTSDYGKLYLYNTGASLMAQSDTYFSSGALNDEFNLKISIHKTEVIAVLTCTAGTNVGKSVYLKGSSGGFGATCNIVKYQHGGTFDVTRLVYASQQAVGAEYLFEGNSITKALIPTNVNLRYADLLSKSNKGRFIVHAGSGNTSADALSTVSEVVALAPKYVFIFIGTNDAAFGVTTGTYSTNIAGYVSALTSAGYVVGTNIFFISALPRNGVNIVPYNDVLKTNYPTAYIDAYSTFEDPSHLTYLNPKYDAGDQVHLNTLGNQDLAQLIQTFKPEIFTKKDVSEPSMLPLTFARSSTTLLGLPTQTFSPYSNGTYGTYRGLSVTNTYKPIANLTSTFYTNLYNTASISGAYGATSAVGASNRVSISATGSYTSLIGTHSEVEVNTATTIPNAVSNYNYLSAFATGSAITNGYGVYTGLPKLNGGTLTGTNLYLNYIEDASATYSTNLLNNSSAYTGTWTNRWGLYAAGGNHAFAGNSNVGIGVATPSTGRLQIGAGSASVAAIQLTNQTAYTGAVVGAITLENTNDISHVGNVTLKRGATANIGTSDSQTLQLVTGNTARITISTAGNMGIGAIVPTSKLGVLGNTSIGATYATTAAPTNGAIIEGNVGIGTTSPNAKLQVSGTVIIQSYTVATLPACAAGVYQRATVTDALAPAYDVTVTGGGARVIEVLCNGSTWVCH